MECPTCKYKVGEKDDSGYPLGEFFELSGHYVQRKSDSYREEFSKRSVYACPKCLVLFIDPF